MVFSYLFPYVLTGYLFHQTGRSRRADLSVRLIRISLEPSTMSAHEKE